MFILNDPRLPKRDRQCVQDPSIIHRREANADYYQILLHALELQRTIGTVGIFFDWLRLIILASYCHPPCRTFVAQSINIIKT